MNLGRYGTIELIPETAAPLDDAFVVARTAWPGHAVAALFLLGWGIGLPVFAFSSGSVAAFDSLFNLLPAGFSILVIGAISLVCLIAGLAFLSAFIGAVKPGNWILCATEKGLYIKLRSFNDYRLPISDPIVAFIPSAEIRRINALGGKFRVIGDKDGATKQADRHLEKHEFLEIELYGDDLSDVENALAAEKRSYGPTFVPGVTAQAKGIALSIAPQGHLKLDWKTRSTRLTPTLTRALEKLSNHYRTGSITAPDQASIATLDRQAQENRLLEMAAHGNKIDAVVLARTLYKLNLAEATAFLDQLQQK